MVSSVAGADARSLQRRLRHLPPQRTDLGEALDGRLERLDLRVPAERKAQRALLLLHGLHGARRRESSKDTLKLAADQRSTRLDGGLIVLEMAGHVLRAALSRCTLQWLFVACAIVRRR